MHARSTILALAVLVLLPGAYAGIRFGDCPATQGYDCEQAPLGAPFPPHAVTGHTVYANFVREQVRNETLGLPTDFAVLAGYFADTSRRSILVQRECVVWFNGYNVQQRPISDGPFPGQHNAFPSDEDEPIPDDEAYQDYDFDRDVDDCLPARNLTTTQRYVAYAVVVEDGDCDPDDGSDFRFRGHLDFVDPNSIHHEVQEYDYRCGGSFTSNLMADFFPYTGTDPHNEAGCTLYETPGDNAAPPGDLGYFDFGHKCNGTFQDLFREKLWITEIHATMFDPTIQNVYNFAIQFDTCSGINIYEGTPAPVPTSGPGKPATGPDADGMGDGAYEDPQDRGIFDIWDTYHDVTYDRYYAMGLDNFRFGRPRFDTCTDGSSFSFDDRVRGRTVHSGPPPGIGDTSIMRGNSYDFDPASDTVGKHRTNCRHNDIDWRYNTYPEGPPPVGGDCYPEDHKSAQVDVYVFEVDPTGLFAVNSNGLTGMSAYGGHGIPNGPDEYPPYGP